MEIIEDQQRFSSHEFLGKDRDKCFWTCLCSDCNTHALSQSVVFAGRQGTERISNAVGKCSDIG